MKVITQYESVLGHRFASAEAALADEDRLPQLIKVYETDLARMVPGGEFAGKNLTEAEIADLRVPCQYGLDRFRAMWAEVQAQRAKVTP